jgi:predicted ArsR family transcriptional regulator
MPPTRWDQRFFASTRGQIVRLLRRASRTVDELAQELDLTDNAVRAHLAALERDGLVQQQGVRRGAGKPAYAYALAPEADHLFPHAHLPVLRELLSVLAEEMNHARLEELLHAVGRRMAARLPPSGESLQARLNTALALLNELGGLAELEEAGDHFLIRGYSCPLAQVVPDHPAVCDLVATMLAEILHVPVTEHCTCGPPARCCFQVASGEGIS